MESAVDRDRAYVFLGYTPLEFVGGYARFTLRMSNLGRGPAVIKEIKYKLLQRDALPTSRNDADWQWDIIEYDWVIPEHQTRDSKRFQTSGGNDIFVACITYLDLFTLKTHVSWMGMHIFPDKPEGQRDARAGGDEWNSSD